MKYVNNDNFMIYAARHYDNPSCATKADFMQDLNRINFILKMFKKYEKDGNINERLVLNHLILLYNVFDREAITKMLFLRMSPYLSHLKPFLSLLSFWPKSVTGVGDEAATIYCHDIDSNPEIAARLGKI